MNKFGSFKIKIILVTCGVVFALLVLYFTQVIVDSIRDRETQVAQLYANSIEYIANDTSNISGEYAFIFNEIILQINFPVIATDKDYSKVDFFRNVDIDTTLPKSEISKILIEKAKAFADLRPPIKVSFKDSVILNLVHYGDSDLITQLKLLPYIELIIGFIFIMMGYIGFSYVKKHEQSSLWVGLTRETAHQLGTPLSSLMGWIEILKNENNDPETIKEIQNEIENDTIRLNKIANRFSKIGSRPKLEEENVTSLIKNVCSYLERRIPNLIGKDGKVTKKISIDINAPEVIKAKINKDLFEWVLENMLKNSFDAITQNSGIINFNIYSNEKDVIIELTDTGKGIDKKAKNDIFRPGYSTKKRGWGLGLTLAKRIIEDYHKGKLTLLESSPDKGTTFRIKLKKTNV
ncbi:MAG: HAMP domain-containing histidine kinase [Ignavibacteria bacterium]|nr:HAMP domain-containing histidine kinase [Ignavibacteria bacterium]